MERITTDIFRLQLPYKDIFTTVCLVKTAEGAVLFDSGSYDTDAEEYILPFLQEAGVVPAEIRYIFLSHPHGDHAGGLQGLLPYCEGAKILSCAEKISEVYGARVQSVADGEGLLGCLQVAHIPGHTPDCMALFDRRSGTLISGDCLQQYGIFGSGPWGANIHFPEAHFAALKRLQTLPVTRVVLAHEYYPLGAQVEGAGVKELFALCKAPLQEMRTLLEQNPTLSDEEICAAYLSSGQRPRITEKIIQAVRNTPPEIWE